jgi:ABC-2 type transport system permease protein
VAMLICGLELANYGVAPDPSYSAAYAGRTAGSLLIFLFGAAVFYAGEVMHRDRELRVEPVLWSTPAPDFVLLLSKFSATFLVSLLLVALVALTAIAVQMFKGHAPFEPQAYLMTYAVILVPSIAFMIAASIALNTLLRDKYLTYAVSLAIGGGMVYLISQGYNHLLYNFVLYELWSPPDLLNAGGERTRILVHRVYCLAISTALFTLAHLLFGRRSTKRPKAVLIMLASLAIAAVLGIIVAV